MRRLIERRQAGEPAGRGVEHGLAGRDGLLRGGDVAIVVLPTAVLRECVSHCGFSPDFCHAWGPACKCRGEPGLSRPARSTGTGVRDSVGNRMLKVIDNLPVATWASTAPATRSRWPPAPTG